MTVRNHVDNFSTTTTEALTLVETDIDVDDATGISTALAENGTDIVPLTIVDDANNPTNIEIVHCTGVASNTLTVVRAREGTSAVAWDSGAIIECRATADSLNQITPHFIITGATDTFTDDIAGANAVNFDSEDIDNFGWFNFVSTTRWEPTESGTYLLIGTIHVEDPPPGATARIEVWKQTSAEHTFFEHIPDVYTTPAAWQSATAYSTGDVVIPTTPDGYKYMCTTAGTSNGTEPTWDTTPENTTSDNTVVWTNIGEDKYFWKTNVFHIMEMNGTTDYATIRVSHNDPVYGDATYGAGVQFIGVKING